MNALLDGVRVLDLTRLLPGPFATQFLAQLGAEVIKIEAPEGGDYARTLSPALFSQINRGKASVTLDLRDAQDVEAFRRLAADADVVIESFRPGVMDRLGCGYAALKAINPGLVYAALTGYGQTGPLRHTAGHDINYLAVSGVLDQTGRGGDAPALSNVQIADLAGGALTCAVGVLAAVIGARESGEGAYVDSAMLDGSLALQPVALAARATLGTAPPRGRDTLTGALPNYRVYRCRDGRYLAVGALEPRFFSRLMEALMPFAPHGVTDSVAGTQGGRRGPAHASVRRALAGGMMQALATAKAARLLNRPLHWSLAALFRTRSRDAWVRLLADVDACTSPVLTLEEALAHPQVVARSMVSDDGFGCPLHVDGAPRPDLSAAPALGADNARWLNR